MHPLGDTEESGNLSVRHPSCHRNGEELRKSSSRNIEFGANTLRFYLSSFAMILFGRLREALRGTRRAVASADRLRLRLLKIGALGRMSVRRVHIAMSSACPDQDLSASPGSVWAPSDVPAARPSPRDPAEVCPENTPHGARRAAPGPFLVPNARFRLPPDRPDAFYPFPHLPPPRLPPSLGQNEKSGLEQG